mmetsp:Transcript_6408/g.23978  ORF Transcript_6408/g.23978 Transcript_6408/m.23978 type:complete len:282 (+) Transcript_6408:1206-2051(+)
MCTNSLLISRSPISTDQHAVGSVWTLGELVVSLSTQKACLGGPFGHRSLPVLGFGLGRLPKLAARSRFHDGLLPRDLEAWRLEQLQHVLLAGEAREEGAAGVRAPLPPHHAVERRQAGLFEGLLQHAFALVRLRCVKCAAFDCRSSVPVLAISGGVAPLAAQKTDDVARTGAHCLPLLAVVLPGLRHSATRQPLGRLASISDTPTSAAAAGCGRGGSVFGVRSFPRHLDCEHVRRHVQDLERRNPQHRRGFVVRPKPSIHDAGSRLLVPPQRLRFGQTSIP